MENHTVDENNKFQVELFYKEDFRQTIEKWSPFFAQQLLGWRSQKTRN